MQDVLHEPVELTEFELDAVAGGNRSRPSVSDSFNRVRINSEPTTTISVDNSVNVYF